MASTCIYGSILKKDPTRNLKRHLVDSHRSENRKNQRLKWIFSTEMNQSQTIDEHSSAQDHSTLNQTFPASFQGMNSLSGKRGGLRQASLWRYFRRKHRNEDKKVRLDEGDKFCVDSQSLNKLFGSNQSLSTSNVGLNPLVNALNGLCLMD